MIGFAKFLWPVLRPIVLPWLVREFSKLLAEAEIDPGVKAAIDNAGGLIRPQMTAEEAKDAARAWHGVLSMRRS